MNTSYEKPTDQILPVSSDYNLQTKTTDQILPVPFWPQKYPPHQRKAAPKWPILVSIPPLFPTGGFANVNGPTGPRTGPFPVPPFFMGKRSVGLALHKPFTSVPTGILGGGHTQDVCINLHNIKNDVFSWKKPGVICFTDSHYHLCMHTRIISYIHMSCKIYVIRCAWSPSSGPVGGWWCGCGRGSSTIVP